MISNLVINQQKMVLFVDDVGMERVSHQIITLLLKQQGQDPIRTIPSALFHDLQDDFGDITMEAIEQNEKTNVILQPLSKLLTSYKPSTLFAFVNKLKNNSNIKQIFLWATTKNISENFVVPFMEYLSDSIVTLVDPAHLTIVTRKVGGMVTNKYYQYQLGSGDFAVKEIKKYVQKPAEPVQMPQSTFKIELEEDEIIARSSVRLPYERTKDSQNEGQILYMPDANDDFDEEDPDDDLDF